MAMADPWHLKQLASKMGSTSAWKSTLRSTGGASPGVFGSAAADPGAGGAVITTARLASAAAKRQDGIGNALKDPLLLVPAILYLLESEGEPFGCRSRESGIGHRVFSDGVVTNIEDR